MEINRDSLIVKLAFLDTHPSKIPSKINLCRLVWRIPEALSITAAAVALFYVIVFVVWVIGSIPQYVFLGMKPVWRTVFPSTPAPPNGIDFFEPCERWVGLNYYWNKWLDAREEKQKEKQRKRMEEKGKRKFVFSGKHASILFFSTLAIVLAVGAFASGYVGLYDPEISKEPFWLRFLIPTFATLGFLFMLFRIFLATDTGKVLWAYMKSNLLERKNKMCPIVYIR